MAVKIFRHLSCISLWLALNAMFTHCQTLNRPPAFLPGNGDMARFSLPENTPVGSSIYQLKGEWANEIEGICAFF